MDPMLERADQPLALPTRLTSDTRPAFRAAALQHVEHAAASGLEAVLDLGAVAELDAVGAGALHVVQRHADHMGVVLRLANASEPVRALLRRLRLEPYFTFSASEAH